MGMWQRCHCDAIDDICDVQTTENQCTDMANGYDCVKLFYWSRHKPIKVTFWWCVNWLIFIYVGNRHQYQCIPLYQSTDIHTHTDLSNMFYIHNRASNCLCRGNVNSKMIFKFSTNFLINEAHSINKPLHFIIEQFECLHKIWNVDLHFRQRSHEWERERKSKRQRQREWASRTLLLVHDMKTNNMYSDYELLLGWDFDVQLVDIRLKWWSNVWIVSFIICAYWPST